MKLRVIRRLSSFELPAEELVKVEFWNKKADQPDLRPSVYAADPSESTRVMTEHAASFLSPPRRVEAVRVDGPWAGVRCLPSRGATGFAFANERHHEYEFIDAAQLLHCVARLRDGYEGRVSVREKAELLAYVRDRLAEQDPEWVAGLKVLPNGPKWLDLVGA